MKKEQIEAIRRQAKANQQRKDERKSQWETAKKEAEAIIEARKFNHICGKEMQKVPKPSDTTAALIPCVMCDGFLKLLPDLNSFPEKCAMIQDIEHCIDHILPVQIKMMQIRGKRYFRRNLKRKIEEWEGKQHELLTIFMNGENIRWCEFNCEWWKAKRTLEVLKELLGTKK